MSINLDRLISVVFDGEAFRPEMPIDLAPNTRYLIVIRSALSVEEIRVEDDTPGDVYDLLESMVGTYDGPEDWSAEHDHYLYGTPKQQPYLNNE